MEASAAYALTVILDKKTVEPSSARRTASPRGVGPEAVPTGVASGRAAACAEDAAKTARTARTARADIVTARELCERTTK